MASYIGNKPVAGEFKRLDSIAGQFNGVLTSFTLNFNSVSVSAGDASQLIVSLDGVVQEPLGAYTLGVGGSTIVFGTAPVAGSTCHIVQLGGVGGTITGTLTDNIVTTTKIGAGAVTSDRITIDGDILFPDGIVAKFGSDSDLRIYSSGTNSFITHGTSSAGDLKILGENIEIGNSAAVKNFKAFSGAQTILYHNGNTRLTTSLNGIDVTGTASATSFTHTGDSDTYFHFPADNQLSLVAGGAEVARSYQIAGAYGVIRANGTGSATYPNFTFNGDDDTGMYRSAEHTLSFTAGGTKRLEVYSDPSNPSSSFDTSGIKVNGEIGIGDGTSTYGAIGSHSVGRLNYDSDEHWFRDEGGSSLYMSLTNIHPNAAGGSHTSALGIGTSQPQHELDVYGTARFHDAKLKEITASATATGIDVFVYDTRKDSDGGAWRKRTQNTSWYNEDSDNRRGTRKDFPVVAVLVAHSAGVTIYDADDPDMPMWMVIFAAYSHNFSIGFSQGGAPTAVTARDGVVYTTTSGGTQDASVNALFAHNFISDRMYQWNASGGGGFGYYPLPISGRDSGGNLAYHESVTSFDTSKQLVNPHFNDVSVTVMPSAPIDSDTGMPVPTIAVATDGGISIIKDNGEVVDITVGSSSYNIIKTVNVSPDGYVAWRHNDTRSAKSAPIPHVDKNYGFWTYGQDVANDAYHYYESHAYADNLGNIPALVSVGGGLNDHIFGKVVSGSDGLTLIGLQKNEPASVYNTATMPLTSYVTKDYNTGWMMSGITLATLSDTDDTNAVGTELVTNGTFSSDVSGWTAGGGSSVTHQSGQAKVTASSTNIMLTQQLSGLVVGQRYTVSATITPFIGASGLYWGFYLSSSFSGNIKNFSANDQVATEISATFTATATDNYISIGGSSGAIVSGEYLLVDNFSVRLAEPDRSWHENGAQVFGTVTKTAVATGAELVGYSGFSGSNYLQQPYNSDLDFGTGNFSIVGWIKPVASTSVQLIVHRRKLDATGVPIEFGLNNDETPYLYTGNGTTILTGKPLPVGNWLHIVALRRNGFYEIYVNGKLFNTGTGQYNDNITNADAHTLIGGYITNGGRIYPWQGSMALLRISSTAPSEEQITKMYNDERHLFIDNAKATIYGTSSNALAIAYDDVMDHLHVGTSEGRSVFQGLNRIDNTTNAISTSISASNGIVAEE